jgi:hypothetical protein
MTQVPDALPAIECTFRHSAFCPEALSVFGLTSLVCDWQPVKSRGKILTRDPAHVIGPFYRRGSEGLLVLGAIIPRLNH